MAEWLRRLIRNQLGLSRAGSSPVTVVNVVCDCSCFTIFHFFHLGKRGRLYGSIMATNVFNLNEFLQFECIQFEGIQFEGIQFE